MKAIENPKIRPIKPFIQFHLDSLKKSLYANQALYIMDNMMLSKLRKDAVCNPFIIQKGFQFSKLILIPDIILEGASKNLPDEKAFEQYYYELFRILSTEHEIYVVDLEIIFELLRDMIGTKEAAFNILKNISLEAVRTNQTIRDSIKEIDSHSEAALETLIGCIIANGKNAGERFITIFSLALLSLYFGPVYIVSEDEKGIYGPFRTFLNNERLMELINIDHTFDLIQLYQFMSYESLILSLFHQADLSKEELFDLIEKSNRDQSRNILYSLNGASFHTPISNQKLVEWISQQIIKIQF
ncbi:hypothetical protein CX649_00660 [Bacillaceae bacterium ZC4]|nr:hypothetical protein CX649_00660 [Bacillaceae bacterium ZC4]